MADERRTEQGHKVDISQYAKATALTPDAMRMQPAQQPAAAATKGRHGRPSRNSHGAEVPAPVAATTTHVCLSSCRLLAE
jgi:hypothetical protein